MAYNLQPLVQILEQILHSENNHPWVLDPQNKPQIESLYKSACFLKELFESPSPPSGVGIEHLESQIRDTVHEAENILESHMADRILWVPKGQHFTVSPARLQYVVDGLDSLGREIKKMTNVGIKPTSKSPSTPAPDSSRIEDPNPKKILVGISKGLLQLKDRLTRRQPKVEIIPIVGMGGIGKTTLARNVYDDPLIVSHFDIRAWITVSQDYDVRAILQQLLRCVVREITDEMLKEKNDQLSLRLHKSLCGRRYLIVLDDMWDIKVWDEMRKFFPEYNIGSRILITTREMNVANSVAGSDSANHQMNLLNEIESWNLLREKIFAQKVCPPELHKIGKKIAKNCGGLPLAIHVIGGSLSQANRTKDYWQQVAKDLGTVGVNKDEQFSKILSLSYNYLPNYLKPCFLYMGAFPEDYEIRASKLIRLWVAEGFLQPIPEINLEEAAQLYLKALVERNLIFVRRQETNRGNAKSYGLHDLLRDLCVRKASEDKFLYVKNRQVRSIPENTRSLRRVSVQTSYKMRDLYASIKLMPLARTFLCIGPASREILSAVFFRLRLLRVLDVLDIQFPKFPEETLQMVNLRYLALTFPWDLPSSICALRNLQTLVFGQPTNYRRTFFESDKLFAIPQVRHIKFKGRWSLEGWTLDDLENRRSLVFKNLQTLSTICVDENLVGNFQSMPNLKKLGIYGFYKVDYDIDLTCLSKLETLKCSSSMWPGRRSFLSFIIFPPSLKKLNLGDCFIPLGLMGKIARDLPNLEVLKLRKCTFESPTWELAAEEREEEFSNLKFLHLEKLNLVNWIADDMHFPRLERLIIRDCSQLEEIPSAIGDIPTVELIELHNPSTSAADSAVKIREEQIDMGNEVLQVRITGSSEEQHWYNLNARFYSIFYSVYISLDLTFFPPLMQMRLGVWLLELLDYVQDYSISRACFNKAEDPFSTRDFPIFGNFSK